MSSAAPFAALEPWLPARPPLREAIIAARRRPEPECVPPLLPLASLSPAEAAATHALARRLAEGLRAGPAGSVARENMVQGLLQEFSLSSEEGVALMCLAEALLRIPDLATRDALIRDKIGRGDWKAHVGRSASPFVNAAAWGLLVTGRLVSTHDERGLSGALTRITARFGEPVIRKAVDLGMRLMGRQFVAGETIAEALANAARYEAAGFRYSYDMLGEAAMTAEDAAGYLAAYEAAIDAIGAAAAGRGVIEGPGISIKLSALHPRYSFAQRERVMGELYPVLRALALRARGFDIGINIDAEEADRLDISLDLLERLCAEPGLEGWGGVGFVVQAYQKRCPFVVDFVVDLARRTRRRLMVRLVKGAYWDSEIKRAQVDGLDGYPVYTRKVYTDVTYLACARKLLAAPDAVYPQFATHNAQTLAAIHEMAGPWTPGQYEFQCLHGMGEPLYAQVVGPVSQGKLGRPCRIYAPVGTHETLLAYLVRRLLENGSNTSFINRIADPRVSLEDLIASPADVARDIARTEGECGAPHPRIPLPRTLFGALRANSSGLDLTDESVLRALHGALSRRRTWEAAPSRRLSPRAGVEVRNPADPGDVVGHVVEATGDEADAALAAADAAFAAWRSVPPAERGAALARAADRLEAAMPELLGLIVREAGKTLANAVSEVREAVDFLRYYGGHAARLEAASHPPLGVVACISPWNFPLAIFMGQVAAALAAGNVVIAKPAEQTPLIAAQAVRLLHEAGVPADAVQLLPGRGETVGARLVADARVQAVVFTGSTDVARIIQRTLADRLDARGKPVTLVAETGGQNAMIVDSSALAEQVVADAVVSAFDSAGQRCSALRVLCVQEEVADRALRMLAGAIEELATGDPRSLATDVGPVIDEPARRALADHVERMAARGCRVRQAEVRAAAGASPGTFLPPTVIEIDRLEALEHEVFGPVLHVLRYRRDELETLVERINALGFGLTLGIHSRVDDTIEGIVARARVGNVYVNRNIVGAVVGVQPFGGEGLSGTGPKAGGPLYLLRMLARCPPGTAAAELALLDGLDGRRERRGHRASPAFAALRDWAIDRPRLRSICEALPALVPDAGAVTLPGPTGERNSYALLPRERVLCLAASEDDLLAQLALVLAVGARAVWTSEALPSGLRARLPETVRDAIVAVRDWASAEARFDAVLHHGTREARHDVVRRMAARPGPIVLVHAFDAGEDPLAPERLLVERVVSVNTAAAGGNASLMTVG
ncbi:MAG TPA: trifunctional transcriptional regulator/proline dehydrogenase/L-glutamate gamma-semialdehyde dehydrogenase [Usitatibacter sp.]|nr:trifunctional transcriptional regulator/proline dehydrogenase/L-glutamate gamma-semialdehyde dehydrogenase [Usitatibacter sp.]